ncbi:MFS transporter [Phytohabitans flavus]|uniref:MFS transporter n=1 Tax=Phytohabitans flavus TaxID=1076124 RepID=A0A6F8XJS3_9ACTN|nr:MFS transporter [Phytohabitans flavus]BCB74065.1 MFS transporter [Phytohabitans flavus]
MTNVDAPAKAGRREWLALAVLCLPTMLAAVDINVMFLALPHVSEDLGANSTEQLWITDIYGFLISGFLITMGTLGDRIGRRRVLLMGGAAFIVASLLAAYSTSTEMLIASRAVLGIAGAAVTPSVLALIRTMFRDPKQMGAAMGLWGTSLMSGIVLGPVVGGLLLGAFWWGSIFLMAVPIMAVLLIAGPLLLPESRNPDAGRIDLVSVVLSLAAILPVIYGLKDASRNGWGVVPIAIILIGLLSGVLFVYRQGRISNPLLDLTLFNQKALSVAVVLALCAPMFSGGASLMSTLYFQTVEGLTPFRVALWMLVPSIAMIVVGNAAAGASRKILPAFVLAGGGVLAAVGMLLISQVDSGIGMLLVGLTMAFVGGGAVGILSATLIMSSAPPEKAGSAGALSGMLGEFGTALGVAVLGVVGTSVYRSEVDIPGSVPAEAADAARESIAGALPVAAQLGSPVGVELLESARAAFTQGMNVVALVAAVLFAVLAVVAVLGLRQVPPTSGMPMPGGPPPSEEEQAPEAGVRAAS